jgi:targeting protein for Xklp2
MAGKAAAAANDTAQEHQAVKKQKLDDGRTRQVLCQELVLKMELGNSCYFRVLPHKGKGGLAGSTEMTSSSSKRKHHDGAHSLKVTTSSPDSKESSVWCFVGRDETAGVM